MVRRAEIILTVNHNAGAVVQRLEALPGRLDRVAADATRESIRLVANIARGRINRRSGDAAKTIKTREPVRPVGVFAGEVYSTDEIAYYLERGTRAHTIEPRTKKALRFNYGGRTVFARRVRHPGTRAYRWMASSGERAEGAIGREFTRRVRSAIERG